MAHNIQQKKHYLAAPNADCTPKANFKRGWIGEMKRKIKEYEERKKLKKT